MTNITTLNSNLQEIYDASQETSQYVQIEIQNFIP